MFYQKKNTHKEITKYQLPRGCCLSAEYICYGIFIHSIDLYIINTAASKVAITKCI